MILPPEKHLEIAAAFQDAADDESQTAQQRAEDACKAAFWRWLAERAEFQRRFGKLPFIANAPRLDDAR
jgi:hypothetical protein